MLARDPWGGLAGPAVTPPHDVVILGVPYDGSACYRAGAAQAPARLRGISATSPAISEEGYVVDPAALRVHDRGDLAPDPSEVMAFQAAPGGAAAPAVRAAEAARVAYFSRVERAVADILKTAALVGRNTFILSIGGDHSVSIPLIRGFASGFPEGFGLISLDAHPDLFDTYEGSSLSNACPIRRALDTSRLRPEHVLILGTRSYNALELEFMREKGVSFLPARLIDRDGVAATLALARERFKGVGNIYLTIDIDVADPACAPGTGAPVAGGLSSRQVLDLVRGLVQELPVRSMDLVEVSPPLDPTDATLFLALQIVFETFAVLAEKRRPRARGRKSPDLA